MQSQLCEPIGLIDLLGAQEGLRVKIGNFARNSGTLFGSIEALNADDSVYTGHGIFPKPVNTDPYRRHNPHSSNNDVHTRSNREILRQDF
jgi:hypothetical protein